MAPAMSSPCRVWRSLSSPKWENHRHLGGAGGAVSGIVLVLVCGYRNIRGRLAEGSLAVGGLAAMNTASEYGFGAVIAALPGFPVKVVPRHSQSAVKRGDQRHGAGRDHLARLGMSIARAAMSETLSPPPTPPIFRSRSCTVSPPWPAAAWTPCRTRGGDHPAGDHRPEPSPAYGGIFAITVIKSLAVLFVIATFYVTGIV